MGLMGNCNDSLQASTIIREPSGDSFDYIKMKCTSNQQTTGARDDFIPGSIMDFVLEMLVEFITQPVGDNQFELAPKKYREALVGIIETIFGRFLQAAKHNPDIKKLKSNYEVRRSKIDGVPLSLVDIGVSLENSSDADYRADVLGKFQNSWKNALALKSGEGPLEISALIMILTDFSHREGAQALATFLRSSPGVR